MLLDYGGTLDGDALHWFDHFAGLYARLGADVPRARLTSAFYAADDALSQLPNIRSFGLVRMIEAHVGLQLAALERDDAALQRALIDGFVADTRAAWDRNRPLLRHLARRVRLGVVSNSYGNMSALLQDAGLGPFDVVIDSAVVGLRKPDPAIYRLAARALDLPPERILHVGDSWERDVVPARTLGMGAAWLAQPEAVMPASPGNVIRLASLLELRELLR